MSPQPKENNKETEVPAKKKRPLWKRMVRFSLRLILLLIFLLFSLVLFIRSPWGQNFIIQKLTNYVSDKTETEVQLEKLFISFSGDVDIRGLYLNDNYGDTLIYFDRLKADIPVWPMIRGNALSVNKVSWDGLRANIIRKDSLEGFNFQFLLDAFLEESEDDQTVGEIEDKSSNSFKINLGKIDFSDFRIRYLDEVMGIDALVNIGKLHVQGKKIDLENMDFGLAEVTLLDSNFDYKQTKAFPPSEDDSEAAVLPVINLDQFRLQNVKANYISLPDSLEARADLQDFLVELPKADLPNKEILLKSFLLDDSEITFKTYSKIISEESKEQEESPEFSWPDWNVSAQNISLNDNRFLYQNGEQNTSLKAFNPDYLNIRDFNLEIKDLELTEETSLLAEIKRFSFKEDSGINLNKLEFLVKLDNNNLLVQNFNTSALNNYISGDFKLRYSDIQQLLKAPDQSGFDVNLKNYNLDISQVFKFVPELKSNEYLQEIARKKLYGNLRLKGSLAALNVSDANVNWGSETKLQFKGSFFDITQPEKMSLLVDKLDFKTNKNDVLAFVSEEDLGVNLPESIRLKGDFGGSLQELHANTQLLTEDGNADLKGTFSKKEQIEFAGILDVDELQLGKILQNPDLGIMSFHLESQGKGNAPENITGNLKLDFNQLSYKNYDLSPLKLQGDLVNGLGDIKLDFKDENLDLATTINVLLDSISQKADINLVLKGARLKELGLSDSDKRLRINLDASVDKNEESLIFSGLFKDGLAIQDDHQYHLGNLNFAGLLEKDTTSVDIRSKMLNLKLRSNANPDRIAEALKNQMSQYFATQTDTVFENPVHLQLEADISDRPLLTKVLVPEIQSMDSIKIALDFRQEKKLLTADVHLPFLNYSGQVIDSLELKVNADKNSGHFSLGFKEIKAGVFAVNKTQWDGDFKSGVFSLDFKSQNKKGENFYTGGLEVFGDLDTLKIHLKPENLKLNGQNWNIAKDNQIRILKDKIEAENFDLNYENQHLIIANNLMAVDEENIGLKFDNFTLATILGLVNPDTYVANGILEGQIVAVNPMQKPGFLTESGIRDLEILEVPIGQLTFNATSEDLKEYTFDMSVLGDDMDLALDGNYLMSDKDRIELTVNLNKIGLKTIADLAGESLTKAQGYLSGEVLVNGQMPQPEYYGYLQFNDASLRITQLGNEFFMGKERLLFNSDHLEFVDFTIADRNGKKMEVIGKISTADLSNPGFDLKLKADDFQLMNSTEDDFETMYGQLNFDLNGTIKGNMKLPVVNLEIDVNPNTDFTYVMTDTQASIEKQDGIVKFVNKQMPDDIMTRNQDEPEFSGITGLDVRALIRLDKKASFGVIVNPATDDNLKVSGEADLDFRMEPTGRMTLTGRYEIEEGHYKMSLYNLVSREFEFQKGSKIIWQGDPMDADLDITAVYSLKTNASNLMAPVISGAPDAEKMKYKQRLPFLVSMNILGTIDRPELKFAIDMPEDSKGAIGGSVYGRLNQLKEDEGELNRHVFSLLVLSQFYPESGSDGSEGGLAGIARDNLNRVLSDQLNHFSEQLMGDTGVKLSFDLDSYTDYQGASPEQRTDLNISAEKALFDDRLVIKVGTDLNVEGELRPGEERPLVGNASVEYLMTEDGRWRLRGFRKSEYESIIDGQIYSNGIGVVFQRQFNKFRELWKSLFSNPDAETEEPEIENKE